MMSDEVVVFDTVTLLTALHLVLPAASRATALMVWVPLVAVVVFHAREYGAMVSSAPTFAPSTLNCTPTTPTLSDALAEMVTFPETVAPSAGAVRETVGLVVSPPVVTSTFASQVAWPPAPVTVAVYRVETVGETVLEPALIGFMAPAPLSIDPEVAFVLVHESVDELPRVMEAGVAVRVQEGGSIVMLTNLNVFGLFLRSVLL